MATIVGHATQATPSLGVREEPVLDSSFIQKLRYDASSFILTVTMKSGAEYLHFMVYPQVFEDFLQAKSKGQYYANVIKGKTPGASIIDKKVGRRDILKTKVRPSVSGRKEG